ncbi:MAG: hypothetical protein KF862_08110 [Chitinophagaceae bacterium]|nr:hypothetical protein [Chitinophagaceae bacterium]
MSITSEQYERIIRFLDADMEPDEMNAFEKELDSHPEMRAQLDFEQSLRDNFALGNITSLPGTVPAKENPADHTMPGRIMSMRKWIAVGAAVITACMLFTIFWQKPRKAPVVSDMNDTDTPQAALVVTNRPDTNTLQQKSDQVTVNKPETEPAKDNGRMVDLALLFKQYFKKEALPENYPLYLAAALTDYESGNYQTLQQLSLNNLPQTRGANGTDSKENILQLGHYYKGLAFLQTSNTKEAIINLDWVVNNQPGKALKVKAQWHLVLAYLKENNREKAVELCRNIVNNKQDPALVKNAEKILDSIGK